MIKQLKNNFTHAALGTIVWIVLLTSLTSLKTSVPFYFFWNILAIGALAGILLGVIYPVLWNYFTYSAPVNIIVSTFFNVIFQFTMVFLYSEKMLHIIKPYFLGIALLTLIAHIIAFYLYRKYQNKKMAKELNCLNKKFSHLFEITS